MKTAIMCGFAVLGISALSARFSNTGVEHEGAEPSPTSTPRVVSLHTVEALRELAEYHRSTLEQH